MRKTFYISLLIINVISCSQNEKELPQGIISQPDMVDLMVDIEIAQAKVKFQSASEGTVPNYVDEFNVVYKKHQMNKELFFKNINYYCKEPIRMRRVYDDVIVKLSEKQAELNKKQFNN